MKIKKNKKVLVDGKRMSLANAEKFMARKAEGVLHIRHTVCGDYAVGISNVR